MVMKKTCPGKHPSGPKVLALAAVGVICCAQLKCHYLRLFKTKGAELLGRNVSSSSLSKKQDLSFFWKYNPEEKQRFFCPYDSSLINRIDMSNTGGVDILRFGSDQKKTSNENKDWRKEVG